MVAAIPEVEGASQMAAKREMEATAMERARVAAALVVVATVDARGAQMRGGSCLQGQLLPRLLHREFVPQVPGPREFGSQLLSHLPL